jgi:hypothetical protein
MKNHSKSKLKEGEVFRQFDVLRLHEVANFGTANFLLKIIFPAKYKRLACTKFAIAQNVC